MASRIPCPSVADAERAIYIDFEGTEVDPPSFLGAAWRDGEDDHFIQFILEEGLWPAAEAKPELDRGTGLVDGRCVKASWVDLGRLRTLSETEGRRIFAWSSREQKAFEADLPDGADRAWFVEHIEDARLLAREWKKQFHNDVVFKKDPKQPKRGRNRLELYMKLIGYDVPRVFGPGNSAGRIRDVRDMLAKRDGDYSSLTTTVKGKWTKALKHNWYDCDGMRAVVIECARDLG